MRRPIIRRGGRPKIELPPGDATRLKSAEEMLKLGKPISAMKELQRLTGNSWGHPRIEQVFWRVAQAIG